MGKSRVLVVEDDDSTRAALCRVLEDEGYELFEAADGGEALRIVALEDVEVVLLDYFLPDTDAGALLPLLLKPDFPPEVVVISDKVNTKQSADCMKRGACDFLPKPYDGVDLIRTIDNACFKHRAKLEHRRLVEHNLNGWRIIGNSPAISKVKQLIDTYAPTRCTVLILGESGTGKELVARQLHFKSPRAGGPLRIINCASIPRDLADSELFGHVKGTFTSAAQDRAGKVAQADGGTLFLDEIGDMPVDVQAKLLRFLDTGEYDSVGKDLPTTADVRLIAATNKDLGKAVEEGRFRQDLYYRLEGFTVRLPPLRDRRGDIPLLVEHFAFLAALDFNRLPMTFSAEAISLLRNLAWPGNIRELRSFVEKVTLHYPHAAISARDVTALVDGHREASSQPPEGDLEELTNEFERGVILDRLEKHGGSLEEVAASLDLHLSTLYRKMVRVGLLPGKPRSGKGKPRAPARPS